MSVNREATLQRYRHLRAINKHQQSAALDCVAPTALLDCARRLSLARGRTFTLENPDEMTLVFDLVVHAGGGGRSRAIERYAEKTPPSAGSDEEFMLTAARNAKFAAWQVIDRHETIGLNIREIVSQEMLWLVDEALEASCSSDALFASRLMVVDDFVMTCGAVVPIDEIVLAEAWRSMPRWLAASRTELMQDPRLAAGLFRAAIQTGMMATARFLDPTKEDLHAALLAG